MCGLPGPKDRMFYFGVTALGALKDKAVELYNEGARSSFARRAGCARDFLQKTWTMFSEAPPNPIVFPEDPDGIKQYILALTLFAQMRRVEDPHVNRQRHTTGYCVCDWIPEEKRS